jgi:large conductance mechanosensitive channel protein
MLPGNVLDLAVVVVIGVAFGAVVTALVKDLIPPLIAAVIGRPDFSAIEFTDHQEMPGMPERCADSGAPLRLLYLLLY